MCVTGLIAGGSALLGAVSADKAADAQTEAADKQIEFSQGVYDQQTELLSPWVGSGQNALNALMYELGMGPKPTFGGNNLSVIEENYSIPGSGTMGQLTSIAERDRREAMTLSARRYEDANRAAAGQGATGATTGTRYKVGDNTFGTRAEADAYVTANSTPAMEYGGFEQSQDYLFRLNEGLDATAASAANRHGLMSGSAQKSLNNYASDYASQERGNYLNRLYALSGQGQSAATGTASAAGALANNVNTSYANAADATSAGYIGGANAIQGGLNNGLNLWAYKQAQQ